MKRMGDWFAISVLMFVLLGSLGTISACIYGVSTNTSPIELKKMVVDSMQVWFAESKLWINTGDNLLSVLGMLAGFVMSGGLWQWRKAKAFQRGFDKGFKERNSAVFTAQDVSKALFQDKKEDEFSKIESGIRTLAQDNYKQKYDALLDEHSKRIQELIELKQEMEEWKVDLQKERDAVNAKVVNTHHEYQKEAKQKEEKYLSSCEAIKKQGVDEGMREVAAQIVRHFLNCREVCYGLDSTTGAVRLWADSDKKYMLTHALVSSLIDLSGMRKPSEGNTVPFAFGRKLEPEIGEKWQTTGTANKVDCYIQSFDKAVYDKFTDKEEWYKPFLKMTVNDFIRLHPGVMFGSNYSSTIRKGMPISDVTWDSKYTVESFINCYGVPERKA